MTWIKIEHVLPDKPEVIQMADILEIDETTVIGHLVRFWIWADGQLSASCPEIFGQLSGISRTKAALDRRAGIKGFCDAMISVGWLGETENAITVPNFDYHMGKSAKTRAEDQKRKEVSRKQADKKRTTVTQEPGQMSGNSRTKLGPEKRREEKSNYIPGDDVVVPKRINTSETIEAVGRWIAHLHNRDLATGTTKAIERNSPQEQELWRMLGAWKSDPEVIVLAISTAISSNWQNLRAPEKRSSKAPANSRYSPDLLEVLKVCKANPGSAGREERKS
jgi:hypothetical protein